MSTQPLLVRSRYLRCGINSHLSCYKVDTGYGSSPHKTIAEGNLRKEQEPYEIITLVPQGAIVTVEDCAPVKEFSTGMIGRLLGGLTSKKHIRVTFDSKAGWLREDVVGGKDVDTMINIFARHKRDEIQGFLPTGQLHPDIVRLERISKRVPSMVRGVDTSKPKIDVVKTILENIKKQQLFAYTGAAASDLNFLSGDTAGGDCSTLCKSITFICTDILKLTGVETIQWDSPLEIGNNKCLFNGKGPPECGWRFANHAWLIVEGYEYDALFDQDLCKGEWSDPEDSFERGAKRQPNRSH